MNCFSPHSIVLVVLWFSGAIFHLLAIVMFCVIMLVLCLSYAAAAHQLWFCLGDQCCAHVGTIFGACAFCIELVKWLFVNS